MDNANIQPSISQSKKYTGNSTTWTKGQSGNPKGRPAAGVQGFKDRLAHWLEVYTVGQIEEIIENPKKWNKLLAIDAMVAMRISQACKTHGKDDFVALLDRMLGKPAQTAEISVTHGLADRLNRAEAIMLEAQPIPEPLPLIAKVETVAEFAEVLSDD